MFSKLFFCQLFPKKIIYVNFENLNQVLGESFSKTIFWLFFVCFLSLYHPANLNPQNCIVTFLLKKNKKTLNLYSPIS